jgi:ABC-type oligopeptide transport system substrate-binding subunit
MNDLFNRFIVAIENIGNALQVIASGQQTLPLKTEAATPVETKETKPRTPKVTKAADPAPDTKAAEAAKAAEEAQAAADAKAKAAEKPTFDYELLKKAIIELANAGAEGKEAAVRILNDAGLEKGQKASDAAPGKWEGMYNDAVASLSSMLLAEGFETSALGLNYPTRAKARRSSRHPHLHET